MYGERTAIIGDRRRVCLLLASAPHPLMDRLIRKYSGGPLEPSERYVLESQYSAYDRRVQLGLEGTDEVIDARTAASYTLIYACWTTDFELTIELIQDLRELIDINTLIEDGDVLDWTLEPASRDYNRSRMDVAVDICRLLIVYYGFGLRVHRPESIIRQCCNSRYADVIVYIVTVYDSVIGHDGVAGDVFRCLVKGRQDEAAEVYLHHYKDCISDHLWDALMPAALRGSTIMFRLVLDAFKEEITADDITCTFRVLCSETSTQDWNNKIAVAFETWADQLASSTIETSLVNNWVSSMAIGQKPDMRDRLGHMAHVVIRMGVDLLQDQGIEIAMGLCCYHRPGALLGPLLGPIGKYKNPQCCCSQDLEI